MVHSWENVYSLDDWVNEVDVLAIAEKLTSEEISPVRRIRDFIGCFNEQWYEEFYSTREVDRHKVISRVGEIFEEASNDGRSVKEI